MYSVANALAFWKPVNYSAIKQNEISDRFKIDQNVISIRAVASIALGAVALLYATGAPKDYFLAIVAMPLLTQVYKALVYLENWRATKALNHLAKEIFLSYEAIPVDVMDYATNSPSLVKSLLAIPKILNKKECTKQKMSLTEIVMNKSGMNARINEETRNANFKLAYGSIKNHEEYEEVLKILIEDGTFQKGKINNYLLPFLLNREFASFAIKNGAVQPSDYTEESLVDLWASVHDKEMVKLLKEKGFSIDAVDSKGRTPLIQAIKMKNLSQVCFLLKHGASRPSLDEVIVVEEKYGGDNLTEVTLGDYISNKPAIFRALEQALQMHPDINVDYQSFELPEIGFSAISFPRPAVLIGGNREKFTKTSINDRIFLISGMTIGATASLCGITRSPITPFLALPSIVFGIYLYKNWEKSRATKLLNDLALKEFNNAFPNQSVTNYIASSPVLMTKLLRAQNVAFKMDDNGKTLWDRICKEDKPNNKYEDQIKFSIFRTLADKIFSEESGCSLQEKKAHFLTAIDSNNPSFIKYLLENNKIQSSNFDEKEQYALWEKLYVYFGIRNVQISSLLVENGFNIDAKNIEGRSILMITLFTGSKIFLRHIDNALKITKELLELGALANTKLSFEEKDSSVLEFVKNTPALYNLLEKYMDTADILEEVI